MITKFKIYENSDVSFDESIFGIIDPEDNSIYGGKSDKERYKEFLISVKEQNIKEDANKIYVNIQGIFEDYVNNISDPYKHFRLFLEDYLIGKYIIDGFVDIMEDKELKGVIKDVMLNYSNNIVLLNLKLKDKKFNLDNVCREVITLDKMKTKTSKYNL